jgi:hypothetical protein
MVVGSGDSLRRFAQHFVSPFFQEGCLMSEASDPTVTQTDTQSDLVSAIRRALEGSSEPRTVAKIRSQLPAAFRGLSMDELTALLRRQAAAGVFIQYPRYRSQHDRFWDRPMPVHIAQLIRDTLEEKPLTLSELRRKLPDYAKAQADAVHAELVDKGELHRHPVAGGRGGPRYGVRPPEAKEFLRGELTALFRRLEQLGFSQAQLRHGAIELLHEEEWATSLATPAATEAAETPRVRRDSAHGSSAQTPHETVSTPTMNTAEQ